MSFSSRRYTEYSSYFVEIDSKFGHWDQQVHVHPTEEIFLFLQTGTCRLISNGVTLDIPTPAVVWNRAGSFHQIVSVTDTTDSYVLSYFPQVLHNVPEWMIKTDFLEDSAMFALPLDLTGTYRMQLLFASSVGSPLFQRQLLLPCIFHQIGKCIEDGLTPIRISDASGYIAQVIKLLQSPSAEKITTKALAQRFHVGQTKLKADFKRITNMPIHSFRLREQVRTARIQLLSSTLPLAQIAADCGFTDESHLVRAFRAEYGITPGMFRRKYKSDFRNAGYPPISKDR